MSEPLEFQSDGDWDVTRRNNDAVSSRLRQPLPNVRVTHNAAQVAATGVNLVLAFNTELWNVGNMHSTAVNNSRLTAKITGLYSIKGNVTFAANGAGAREVALRVNGLTFIADVTGPPAAATTTSLIIATEYRLAAGDYVELVVSQTSGGNLNINSTAAWTPQFMMHRIGGYTNEGIA